MGNLARDHRNRDLGVIHMARKHLEGSIGMSDADYRAILVAQGGLSCPQAEKKKKNLDHLGRQRVIEHFKRLGFKVTSGTTAKRPARPTPAKAVLGLVKKIRAQLISLGNLPDTYADAIAKQQLGDAAPEFFEWCKEGDLRVIVQALAVQQKRVGAKTK